MATEITPQAVGAAIVELIGLLPEGSAQPEPDLTNDEIAALEKRGYKVTKSSAEKPAETKAETKQGAEQTGITNVTDLLKIAGERAGKSSSDPLSKIADPTRRADAQVLQEHRSLVRQIAGQHRR